MQPIPRHHTTYDKSSNAQCESSKILATEIPVSDLMEWQEPPIVVEQPKSAPQKPRRSGNISSTYRVRIIFILGAVIVILTALGTTAAGLAISYASKWKSLAAQLSDRPAQSGAHDNAAAAQTSASQRETTASAPTTQTIVSASPTQTVTQTSLWSSSTLISASTFPSASTSAGPGGVAVECPSANGTVYTSQGQKFLRLCATEHPPQNGSVDAGSVEAQSMEDCIDACTSYNARTSGQEKCIGVNWIYRKPQGDYNSYCWLKSKVGSFEMWEGCEAGLMID